MYANVLGRADVDCIVSLWVLQVWGRLGDFEILSKNGIVTVIALSAWSDAVYEGVHLQVIVRGGFTTSLPTSTINSTTDQ